MNFQRSDGTQEPLGHFPALGIAPLTHWARGLWLLPILMLAAGVRFYDATASAIWCDEGSSLLMSQYSPLLIWFHSAHDVHPPLYYLLLHGWIELFGNSLLSIRTLSVLPGIATVALGMWLVRLIATRPAAVLAGVLLALLPIAVRYSQEVRMYSFMGLWLMGATLALVYWVNRPDRLRYLAIYVLLMTASFYTHYFTGLCVLAHWTYLLLVRNQPPRLITRKAWWAANALIVLLYSPWIPSLVDQLQNLDQLRVGGDVGWIPAMTRYSLPSTFWQFMTLSDGLDVPAVPYLLLPAALAAIAAAVALGDRSAHRLQALLVCYTFVPLAVIYLVSFASPLLVERYLMFAALGLPLIVAIFIDRLQQRSRWLAGALLVLVIGVCGVGLKNDYTVQEPQFDSLVGYVNQHYAQGDRIIISDLFWYFPYVYYDRTGVTPQLYTPTLPNGTSSRPNDYGFGTLVNQDASTLYLDTLQALPQAKGRVWLIGSSDPADDFAHIPTTWNKLAERTVGDARARLYSPPQG
ncbi:MAG: glycosyltransferase family 39 protein [Pseudomonas sp.]|nr:glycosyltransferase family 39 protein [Pseudomonas sp.]